MTTQIVPASGAGCLMTQQGIGTTPGYSALDDRRQFSPAFQEGVYGTSTLVTAGGVSNVTAADFMVTQRAVGANMSVDVNMPTGGQAYVQGDTLSGGAQGLYGVPVHSANINEAIAAADPSNPRVDQLILEVQDNAIDGSGGNQARTRVLTGTPSPGATLTNRTGAAALPGSALLLADVLVGAGVSSVGNAVIRDRRKWARGAFLRIARTSANYSTGAGTLAAIDGTNLNPRIECSGAPVRVWLETTAHNSSADIVTTGLQIDGTAVDGTSAIGTMQSPTGGVVEPGGYRYLTIPSAGSHQFTPTFAAGGIGTATLNASTVNPLVFIIEELLRSNAQNNNGVTTG